MPRYVTMAAQYRKAYDQFNAIVRADGSAIRLSASSEAGAVFWCSPSVEDFWLRRFAISRPADAQPSPVEKRAELSVEDWIGWEVLYVEHLIRHRMLPGSQQAITEHTARLSRGEQSFLCVVKFPEVWRLEAARRDDDDILLRAAAKGLDPFTLAPAGQ